MGLFNFGNLPFNTLVGADWHTFSVVTRGQRVDPGKRAKFRLTKCVCRLLSLLAPMQQREYRRRLGGDPLRPDPFFIIGHWRSGTTFVHNIFAQDKHFGYTTTYQTVFPHFTLTLQWFFKPFMRALMPDKRPTDHLDLLPDQPQEEEFAINNACPYNYYNFWFFPERMQEYCDRYLTFRDITPQELAEFKSSFDQLVRISLWNTGGTQYLSKNPPHTGRLRALCQMYPDARFLYLVRNPYTVFESTRDFFRNMLRTLELHSIGEDELERNILRNYTELYRAYKEQRSCVPRGHLLEMRFEDFERDPLESTGRIYRDLGLPGWEAARPAIERYIGAKRGYRKNKYQYDRRTVELVNKHWGEALDDWGYERLSTD